MPIYDWRPFLSRWSREALAADPATPGYDRAAPAPPGWLGAPGATEAQLAALEARLGAALPPSYRAFLQVSNGWGRTTPFIDHLWSSEEVDWFAVRNQDWVDAWTGAYSYAGEALPTVPDATYLQYGEDQDCALLRLEYLQSALEISETGDSAIYLLNPQIVTPAGEWEAWFFATWLPGARRYPSFWELMQGEYRSFRQLAGSHAGLAE
jgi:hypothetical protein